MHQDIRSHIQCCNSCQWLKEQKKKYGYLPMKEAEHKPWEQLCVDLIGEYTIKHKGKNNNLKMKAVTMIDPATGWFEIKQYDDKRAISIAEIVEQTWLLRYPWPSIITYDQGSEFIGHEFRTTVKDDYGIKSKPAKVWNPQANSILE